MDIQINQLERTIADGIVTTVHYTFTVASETNQVESYGTVTLTEPEGDYIPFDELTQEDVMGWLADNLDLEEIEANLNARLHELDNPIITVGLPWEATDELPS
jgi:hypothetical protein